MDFECKKLTISDDPSFGCTIEFKDSDNDDQNLTIEELLNPSHQYLLIQRSYPEELYDNDWYTIESSLTPLDFSQEDGMYVKLSQKEFEIYCAGVKIVIGLNLSTKEYSRLDKTLRKRFKGKVVMMNE